MWSTIQVAYICLPYNTLYGKDKTLPCMYIEIQSVLRKQSQELYFRLTNIGNTLK